VRRRNKKQIPPLGKASVGMTKKKEPHNKVERVTIKNSYAGIPHPKSGAIYASTRYWGKERSD
jgi:hypothetical protein